MNSSILEIVQQQLVVNTSTSQLTWSRTLVLRCSRARVSRFPSVLPLNTSHISLAHNLVAVLNEHRVYLRAIRDIKETVKQLTLCHNALVGCCTKDCLSPMPKFQLPDDSLLSKSRVGGACYPQRFAVRLLSATSGISSDSGASCS